MKKLVPPSTFVKRRKYKRVAIIVISTSNSLFSQFFPSLQESYKVLKAHISSGGIHVCTMPPFCHKPCAAAAWWYDGFFGEWGVWRGHRHKTFCAVCLCENEFLGKIAVAKIALSSLLRTLSFFQGDWKCTLREKCPWPRNSVLFCLLTDSPITFQGLIDEPFHPC